MLKILVVGDSMVDVYLFGSVSRLSQEAPVPVVKYEQEEIRLGAAANVAMNCGAMGAETTLLTLAGNDEYGVAIDDCGLRVSSIVSESKKTTKKVRIIGMQHQVARIDYDEISSAEDARRLQLEFEELCERHDIIIFSDYGKGALAKISEMILFAKGLGKTVLVDPKGHRIEKYYGADIIKPNVDEIREMVGGWDSEAELSGKVEEFIIKAGLKGVLLTRAAKGMTLFMRGEHPHIVPAVARKVFDVTGAGDTAIAAFAVSLARGMGVNEATEYANKASGVVVEKFGTSLATKEEVFG